MYCTNRFASLYQGCQGKPHLKENYGIMLFTKTHHPRLNVCKMKKLFSLKFMALAILLVASVFSGCKTQGGTDASRGLRPAEVAATDENSIQSLQVNGGLTEKILLTAFSQQGTPYRYGGTSPQSGFDCSGFTRWVFAQNGINLPRSSSEQLAVGRPVAKEDLRPGDLLIYKRHNRGRATHVGIYVGDGKYIHSPRAGRTVEESEAFSQQAAPRFIGARRVFEDPTAMSLSAEQKRGARSSYLATAGDVKPKVFSTASKKKSVQKSAAKKSAKSSKVTTQKSNKKNASAKSTKQTKTAAKSASGAKSSSKSKATSSKAPAVKKI